MSVIVVPTSHIASESLDKVRKALESRPDCVAVELDLERFLSMEQRQASSLEVAREIGWSSFIIYFVLQKAQNWLGKRVGIVPGKEMIEAVRLAEEKGIDVAFIDRDIRETLFRFQKVPFVEKAKLLFMLLKGVTWDFLLIRLGIEKGVMVDLSKVPPENLVREAVFLLKREFPELHKVLVSERDAFMSGKVRMLRERYKRIVVVAGAGHAEGLAKAIPGSRIFWKR